MMTIAGNYTLVMKISSSFLKGPERVNVLQEHILC